MGLQNLVVDYHNFKYVNLLQNILLYMIKKIIPILLLLVSTKLFAQPVMELQNIRLGYDNIQYIAAGDSVNNLQQAEAYYSAGKFTDSKHPDLNLGIAKDNYWVTFSISKPPGLENNFILNLENPRLNDVLAFIKTKNNVLKKFRFGDYYPFSTRLINLNYFAIPIDFKEANMQTIFLFIRHKGNTLQVPIKLLSYNSFYQSLENNYIITGITTGVLLLTFLFALFFFIQSRSRMFGVYALYALFMWAWLWNTEGYGFQYIYPSHPEWATRIGPGLSVLVLVFFIACCLQFCKSFDNSSRLRKILHVLMYLLAVWGILPFLRFVNTSNEENMRLFLAVHFTFEILSVLLLISYLLWVSITKNKIVWFYFAAVIITLICSTILVAKHTGLVDLPVSSGTFMGMGSIIEMIVMTAGITLQFYNYKKEKEKLLISYLQQQKAINQQILLTEETERKRIARELHDDIGAGLTRIALMSEAAKNKVNVSAREIDEIAQTCRRLVGNMGEIVWSLSPENNSLEALVAYTREELHKLLEYSGIQYNLYLPEFEKDIQLTNEQRRNILLITKELVHNAVKYSQAKNIIVQASMLHNDFIVSVKDDGDGFDEATVKHGNGIRNMRQRILELGGHLTISSEAAQGTHGKFRVTIN